MEWFNIRNQGGHWHSSMLINTPLLTHAQYRITEPLGTRQGPFHQARWSLVCLLKGILHCPEMGDM